MWKTIASYFFGDADNRSELTLDEAYNVLSNCAASQNAGTTSDTPDTEDEEFSTYHKTGYITAVEENNMYIIDNIYEAVADNLHATVGSKVSYITYMSQGKCKVTNMEIINSDWDCFTEVTNHKWCTRILASKVISRSMRDIIVEPGNIKINLNEVSSEFVPIVGDWLEIDVKCEIDENVADLNGNIIEVNKLSPLRIKQITGIIKQWDSNTQRGVIDRNISFSKESLSEGYIPFVGDRIITEAIESEQGQCFWRSLKVVPDLKVHKNDLETLDVEDFAEHVEGLDISDVCITSTTINEVRPFTVEINNNCVEDLVLLEVKFSNANGQCSINDPQNFKNLLIQTKSLVKLQCSCKVKSYGRIRELLLFIFKNVTVGRWVTIILDVKLSEVFGRSRYTKQNFSSRMPHNNVLQGDFLKGQRPILPPRFISNQLPEYKVPQKLWDIVVSYSGSFRDRMELSEEIQKIKPCLKSFNFNTYEDFFHTLIHIEEIANIMAMKIYDQDRTCFIPNGEYLMLEIENLSERRPSLMIGDKIVAKDPYNANSYELEGFIHKVGAKHVYLKFGQEFHETYKGEDYEVTVVCSRTTYRKRHQAIGLAMRNLGRDILFPSKVQLKEPQLKFTYEKYEDELQLESRKDGTNHCVKENVIKTPARDTEVAEKKVNRNKHILDSLQKSVNTGTSADTVSQKPEESYTVNGVTKLLLSAEENNIPYKR